MKILYKKFSGIPDPDFWPWLDISRIFDLDCIFSRFFWIFLNFFNMCNIWTVCSQIVWKLIDKLIYAGVRPSVRGGEFFLLEPPGVRGRGVFLSAGGRIAFWPFIFYLTYKKCPDISPSGSILHSIWYRIESF